MSEPNVLIYRCSECGHYEGSFPQAGCCSACGTGSDPEKVLMVELPPGYRILSPEQVEQIKAKRDVAAEWTFDEESRGVVEGLDFVLSILDGDRKAGEKP